MGLLFVMWLVIGLLFGLRLDDWRIVCLLLAYCMIVIGNVFIGFFFLACWLFGG